MKARLVAIAAALIAGGVGIFFYAYNDAAQAEFAGGAGALEIIDRSQCSMSNCNAAACNQAQNILNDAGSGSCSLKMVECPVRLGARARALAADAGVSFGPGRYQQVRFVAMKCPSQDGGNAFGVAVDDAGWPVFATSSVAFPCAWKARDGGVCTRVDGGNPGFENTMQPGQFAGAGCQLKACVEIAGDSSAP